MTKLTISRGQMQIKLVQVEGNLGYPSAASRPAASGAKPGKKA